MALIQGPDPLHPRRSPRPIYVASVLNSVDEYYLLFVQDFVNDSIVAATCRTETLKVANERSAESVRIACDRTENRRERHLSYLGRQSIEVTQTFRRDLDLVHRATSNVVAKLEALSLGRFFA